MARKGGPRVDSALRNPSYLSVANIIGIKNLDSNNDVDAIEEYIAENGDPYQNQLDAANRALEEQRNREIQRIESQNQTIEALTLQFQQASAQRSADMQAQLDQQQEQFDQQLAFQQAQAAAARAEAAEQARLARNQANAFVPPPNENAQSVTAGDDREDLLSTTTKKKKLSELDELSIVSGIGSQGNPLAGLQIA